MSRCACFTSLITAVITAAPLAAQTIPSACLPVVAAERKQAVTPSHGFTTHGSARAGTPTTTEEIISLPDAAYGLTHAGWRRLPITQKDVLDQLNGNLKETKVFSCRQLPDETVNGTASSVYQAHTENARRRSMARSGSRRGAA